MKNESRRPEDGQADQPAESGLSRRSFLSRLGAMGLATATASAAVAQPVNEAPVTVLDAPEAEAIENAIPVRLKVNGKALDLKIDPRTSLLDCLRETASLTGTKKGCDHGQCGACTVHVNGRRINSCLTLAAMHEGDEITTIEGLGSPENMHPMQASLLSMTATSAGIAPRGRSCRRSLCSRSLAVQQTRT